MNHYVITFNSINDALKAEKLTEALGGTIIPIPSEISADCGFALWVNEIEDVKNIEFGFSDAYKVTGKGKTKHIELITMLPGLS